MRGISVPKTSAAPFSIEKQAAEELGSSDGNAKTLQENSFRGTLFIVPLPIGNPGDVSLHTLRVLREVSCIAAENVSVSRRMLAQWQIETRLLSYQGRDGKQNRSEVVSLLKAGASVALICDAGTPGITDPGSSLVRAALAAQARVRALPGPAAAIVALIASGLPTDRFAFDGFPPQELAMRSAFFDSLARESRTIILYERASRLSATLKELQQAVGSDRKIALGWNLTSPTELWLRGTIGELVWNTSKQARHGQVTIVLAGLPV